AHAPGLHAAGRSLRRGPHVRRGPALLFGRARRPRLRRRRGPLRRAMPLDDEDIRKIVQAVRAVLNAEQSVSGAIGERWTGGQLVMKPGKAGTQEKTVPIEAFFRKIVAVRERLRMRGAGAPVELIDVREEEEWRRGHLPGARHLCKGIIERDIEQAVPDHDAHLVLYCGGGFRSALAADALQKMGYTRAESMDGGW